MKKRKRIIAIATKKSLIIMSITTITDAIWQRS